MAIFHTVRHQLTSFNKYPLNSQIYIVKVLEVLQSVHGS